MVRGSFEVAILPDQIKQVAIEGGELYLSPAYDVLHRWQHLGFTMLKYWNHDTGKMCNIPVDEAGAEFLQQEIGLLALPRDDIYDHENEIYLEWTASQLDDLFGE